MRTIRGTLALALAALTLLVPPAEVMADVNPADSANAPASDPAARSARLAQAALALVREPESLIAMPPGNLDKSLANGLYMSGPWNASWSSGTVVITLDRINNDSFTRTSGTLRLELWAVSSAVGRGESFTGYRLAVSSTFSPLATRTYYSNISRTSSFVAPPDGQYWLNLVLTEYSSTCTLSDGYCMQDSALSASQVTFGSPAPSTVTVYSASGSQCYQNYPYSAFLSLQNAQPGLFTSYPSSTTCASLGVSFFAGYLAGSSGTVPVYTTNSTIALVLCQSGAVVSCTVSASPPAANYSDLWWNPAESGWGVSFTQHTSGIAFVAWFTYDSVGNPKWYVASNCTVSGTSCSGALYETSGPPFGPTFNPSSVSITQVGNITFNFSSSSTGTMSYTVHGISGSKSITRQPF